MKVSWYDKDLEKHCTINVSEEQYNFLTHYEEVGDESCTVLDLINDTERSMRSFEVFKNKVKEAGIPVE